MKKSKELLFAAAFVLTAALLLGLCGAALRPERASERRYAASGPAHYRGISSMVNASMISPSLMSLNFSTVRPHS